MLDYFVSPLRSKLSFSYVICCVLVLVLACAWTVVLAAVELHRLHAAGAGTWLLRAGGRTVWLQLYGVKNAGAYTGIDILWGS